MRSNWSICLAAVAVFIGAACSTAVLAADDSSSTAADPSISAPRPHDSAEEPVRRGVSFSPNMDIFIPSDSVLRDHLGSTWTGIGVSFAVKGSNSHLQGLRMRITGVMRQSFEDHAYIFPVGLSYTKNLEARGGMSPYVGASLNANFADVKVQSYRVNTGLRVAPGICVFAGTDIGKHISLEACHYVATKVGGFDIGGTNLSLKLRF